MRSIKALPIKPLLPVMMMFGSEFSERTEVMGSPGKLKVLFLNNESDVRWRARAGAWAARSSAAEFPPDPSVDLLEGAMQRGRVSLP
jgi:hypothetical protein